MVSFLANSYAASISKAVWIHASTYNTVTDQFFEQYNTVKLLYRNLFPRPKVKYFSILFSDFSVKILVQPMHFVFTIGSCLKKNAHIFLWMTVTQSSLKSKQVARTYTRIVLKPWLGGSNILAASEVSPSDTSWAAFTKISDYSQMLDMP